MTVFLRVLYGPFARTELGLTGKVYAIDWCFFGVREDNSMGHWTLRYKVAERKFVCFLSGCAEQQIGRAPENPNAFVPDKPMVFGKTLAEIMRKRLSNADFASATAASLNWPR
ncbi:hypothetical protein NKL07_22125 [Mesorhizobium sp. C280B]|uniref:hypothetical protein n=1 Tax=unclassified Mesorhizobium TaxID=325217 RepID=UPI0003CE0F8F|nr:hypothetical protein [Mesorhizobium sp. LSJC280B00]ESW92964.1 hypothetical protein X772_03225 [Mesorhizobium sp. LSJC280B00]